MARLFLFTGPSAPILAKALEPGERWITVHPNGDDSKGQPILIRPQPDGSAKVVGGAGGKLNHLRLTGVKSADAYKDTLKERAATRRERAKEQVKRDKELGIHQAKKQQAERITSKKREAQREFVQGVAAAMGWKPEDVAFDEQAAQAQGDDTVVEGLRRAHEREVMTRAQSAVNLNRDRMLADADARADADLGEVPIDSEDPDVLSVQDLDPVRAMPLGLGFATAYTARAEAHGAKESDIKEEAASVRLPQTDAQRKAAITAGQTSKLVEAGLKAMREDEDPGALAPKLVEAKRALDLLKLDKKRRMAERQARDAKRALDESVEEPKAFVIEIDDAKVDEQVAEEVANDLRTISTRAFLSEVHATGAGAVLGRHVGAGAYNSVNALALAAGGAPLVDRSVVDVLGVAGAAEVLARRLATDLSPGELKDVADGMEEFHLSSYLDMSKEAIDRARELKAQAAEMELSGHGDGADLGALQEINRRRGEAINESQKVLGQALGEMEANAALVYALRRGKSDKPFQVSLGETSAESAITQVRALGLQRGEYTLEAAGGNKVLTVLPHGLDRLAAPVNRADLEQVRRNLDIIAGKEDQDGWMPAGIANRPDMDMQVKPGVAPSLAGPFDPGADLDASVRSYIGGRMSDGDQPADILSDLQSAEFMAKVGADRTGAYREVLDQLAPLKGEGEKLQQAESLRPAFEKLADEFCQAKFGGQMAPLHRQTFDVDHNSIDALHRALSAEPTGVAAYKQIGELTPQDQGALRDFFSKHVAKESPEAMDLRKQVEAHAGAEPEREVEDMFGERGPNPDWTDWRAKRDDLASKVKDGSLTWPKYVEAMRTPERAYSAMQDLVRSKISSGFADAYNRLNPSKPLKVGRATVRDNLNHLDAVDPAARTAREAKERALTDSLRERKAGKYAAGSVRDKMDAAREDRAGEEAAQMGFFADEPAPAADKPLGADERFTVGHEAERKIAEMMPQVGANFRPGQPVHLFKPSLSGGKNWPRQRAIKMLAANKRQILSFGTGSGKTFIGLASFAHLHEGGHAKRGLFLVPSIAQGGFQADALRFLGPGKFKWHAQPGASRSERIAAYKDPSNHFAVMTHQSFRDDMLHLGAQHAGVPEGEMGAKLAGMDRAGRQEWLRDVMRREGIAFDYLNVDEGHDTLNRKGKANSTLANVVDALGDSSNYYVSASADPVKNDVSEAFSLLQKMDPGRYNDQAAFMRKYGVDTLAAKDSLRREMARFQYPSKIDPDITATRSERKVDVQPSQHLALAELDKHASAARLARMQGKVDLTAAKALSPTSFEGVPEEEHEAIGREIQRSLGVIKQTAVRKILDGAGGKIDEVAKVAREHAGKQGVVFAHGLDAVEAIRARLSAEGMRVATISGRDTAKEKAKRIAEFRPQGGGEAQHDVLVCSDAGATGANLQSGQWLVNYDTPQTAKTHAQRNGRINRIGQTNDVDLIDLVSDHPEERKARDRLQKKYALREALTTPMESLDDTGLAFFLRQRAIAKESGGLL